MNTKAIAKEWKVPPNDAFRFCEEGMVPTADKIKKGIKVDYDVPAGTPKPPCHRKQAVIMLENIDSIKNENANPWVQGYSYKTIIACYQYFLDCGFISGFEAPIVEGLETKEIRGVLQAALRHCSITKRGNDLISSSKDKEMKTKLKVTNLDFGAKVGAKPAEGYVDVKMQEAVQS